MRIPALFYLALIVQFIVSCNRKPASPGSSSPSSSEHGKPGMSAAVKKPVTGQGSGTVSRTGGSGPVVAFSKAHRPTTPRSKLPAAVRPLLPRRGIYAAGGGLTSGAWRVVVDLDSRQLFAGSNPRRSAPSFGPMPRHKKIKLRFEDAVKIVRIADRVWRAKHPMPGRPIADYDEIIILVDGDEAFFLQGFGPIRSPEGKAFIKKLQSYGP